MTVISSNMNEHSERSEKNGGVSSDCPYAIALLNGGSHSAHHHPDNEVDGSSVQSADDTSMDDLLMATRQNCPAFVKANGCPFKNASSPSQVKETLLQIPSSHYEMSSFIQVLQGLHTTSDKLARSDKHEQFHLPGGCPVPASIKASVPGGFRQSLESMSLAAAMARMAEELEKDESHEDDEDRAQESLDVSVTVVKDSAPTESAGENLLPDPTSEAVPCLSLSLKTGTAAAHEAAENVHFVKNFIRGQIDRRLYGQMVLSLYFIYEALEEVLDVHGPTHFSLCHFPRELSRRKALSDDVEFWHGPLSNNMRRLSPATADYVDRIRYIAARDPLLLLAHSYTRYLGDLSGGKILARVARRALHLDRPTDGGPTDGLAFYHFEAIPSAKLFKDQYRKALDELPLTSDQIQRLVHEANVAFLLNMRIFEELDVAANIPNATVRPMEEVLRFAPENASIANTSSSNPHTAADFESKQSEKCPFMMEKKSSPPTTIPVSQKCPASSTSTSPLAKSKKRCPWPFVVMHDPKQFMLDWQTWMLIGLMLCLFWPK